MASYQYLFTISSASFVDRLNFSLIRSAVLSLDAPKCLPSSIVVLIAASSAASFSLLRTCISHTSYWLNNVIMMSTISLSLPDMYSFSTSLSLYMRIVSLTARAVSPCSFTFLPNIFVNVTYWLTISPFSRHKSYVLLHLSRTPHPEKTLLQTIPFLVLPSGFQCKSYRFLVSAMPPFCFHRCPALSL